MWLRCWLIGFAGSFYDKEPIYDYESDERPIQLPLTFDSFGRI
ncbi:hypothetical protein Poly21_27350 [Allorhodopirellula heiligendammensis]|uniref:Uncharacterized protein n=1 Tax=Allorhodopirellula heiligendammensis TaxID=2714739 RepID=A0A5C6BU30_9BACT|nr:hypothetical protein Poly21_27350 [Allorhodopirellula heiligendammensis]